MLKRISGAALAALALLHLPFAALAATLTVTDITDAGVVQTLAAAGASGDEFANADDGRVFFVVANGGAGSVTVTITAQTTSVTVPGRGTLTKADGGSAVTNGQTEIFGPFPASIYNNTSGRVAVTYSTTTSVTVAAFRLPRP